MQFNPKADSYDEALTYLRGVAKQLLKRNFFWTDHQRFSSGIAATMEHPDMEKECVIIYVYESSRGQDTYADIKEQYYPNHRVITLPMCDMEKFLKYKEYDYTLVEMAEYNWEESGFISHYYGEQKAERSGVYYMNHIEEGLALLEWLGASEKAKKAYCLHPIFQNDADLLLNKEYSSYFDPYVIMLAIEYRSIANKYLSTDKIYGIKDIQLSPLQEVNDMLKADKIQNYKDFELYHKNTHDRSGDLIVYFDNWLSRLGISKQVYNKLKSKLTIKL